jgi:hypothetical protein
MHRFQIQLKQLLVYVTILVLGSFCLQVQATSDSSLSDYRLQKVASNPNQQNRSPQLQTIQSTPSVAQKSTAVTKTTTVDSLDNLTLILLALVIGGLAFVLFVPGKYIRKEISIEDSGISSTEDTPDIADDYLASMDAADEIEQRLDAEDELDDMDVKTQRHIGSRDRKHTNRVASRRKR